MEKGLVAKDIEAELGTARSDDKSSDIAKVPDVLSTDKGKKNVVILGTLVLVNRLHGLGEAVAGITATSHLEDVTQQGLLAVVGSKDGDAARGVPQKAHIHVGCDDILGLSQVL